MIAASHGHRPRYQILLALLILSAMHAAISGSAVGLATVQWDEFTDLRIAESLSSHPLTGSTHDGSQARFPMYVTAAAYRLMQFFDPSFELLDTLPVSRWISILMTVIAIWGTFFLGYRLFHAATGLLAATLFTFSPYVLHFGHDALTQGDAFTSATVVFALISFERFDVQRSTSWLAALSFFLAVAIASKFFLVVIIPALITYHVIIEFRNSSESAVLQAELMSAHERRVIPSSYIYLPIVTGFLALLALTVSLLRFKQVPGTGELMYQAAIGLWLISLLGIGVSLFLALKPQRPRNPLSNNSHVRWPSLAAWLAILPLTLAMLLALFPEHIFNRNVLPILLKRSITMDGNQEVLSTAVISAKLYLGLLLLKNGLPFGLATCVALLWAVQRSVQNRRVLLLVLVLVYYGLLLAILPLQQPFWLMSVYPLILIILAAFILHNLTNLKNFKLRIGWAGYVAASAAWLVVGLINVYPTFGYYGYELVGERWLGSESRGYRAVVVVTNDGSAEAIEWLRKNAPEDSTVLSYLDDIHVINYLVNKERVTFNLQHALSHMTDAEIDRKLFNADFVVVRVVNDLGKPTPVSNPTFIQRFGFAPAYQIVRGRGIYRFPVIQIYERSRLDNASWNQPATDGRIRRINLNNAGMKVKVRFERLRRKCAYTEDERNTFTRGNIASR
jgi:4-amino-4-deoxy-L-arabinose transferase-like glycosyltransferase